MRVHDYTIEQKLLKTLGRLKKRDKALYKATMNKIQEIITCDTPNHYKNLRKPLQHLKRVHITKSFVLVFSYNLSEDSIKFYNLDHHNSIYK